MTKTVHAHRGLHALASRLGVPALPVRDVTYERDLAVPMRDGTVLRAHSWCPQQGQVAPLVLIRTPYGRGLLPGLLFGRLFAHQGLQVVMQSCRGTDRSGGTFDRPFDAEVEDGVDTVQWLREQPWYPGSFATVGGSYFGYTQLALAHAAPSEHQAAVLSATPLTVREIVWPDGAFSPDAALRWAATAANDPTSLRHLVTARSLDKRVRRATASSGPLRRTYQVATERPVGFLETWMEEDRTATVWKDSDLTSALDVLRGAVLVQAGWYDIFLDSSLAQYRRLRERGVDSRLTVGPWNHGQVGTKGMADAVEFLREVLLDGPPRASGARVRLTPVNGSEQHLDDWPLPESEQTFELSEGRLTTTVTAGGGDRTTYIYDPDDPTPQVGGRVLHPPTSGVKDNRKLEARPDVVVFDTDPLATRSTLSGTARVSLTFESDRPATCVLLRLCDVAPQGTSTNLTDRMVVLAANGTSIWEVAAELPPVTAVIDAGHRLRLQASSGASPRFLPHSGTAEPQVEAAQRLAAQQTVHHSPTRPASLTVSLAVTA